MRDALRRPEWRRNSDLETLLARLNGALGGPDLPEPDGAAPPVVLVVGAPRSGTTLAMQMLAASTRFAYPSNFISRFWQAPHVGQMVQSMVVEPAYAFRGELDDLSSGLAPVGFTSDLGKTKGALQPNEFWYFWRRFFDFDGAEPIADRTAFAAAAERFRRALAAFAAAAGKPLAMKGMIGNWYLRDIAAALEDCVFVHIRRDPVAVMRSILNVRRSFFGDDRHWYSFAVPLDADFAAMDAETQVAHQVAAHDVLIPWQLARIGGNRVAEIGCEALVADPGLLRQRLDATVIGPALAGDWTVPPPNTLRPEPGAEPDAGELSARLAEKYRAAVAAIDGARLFARRDAGRV